MTLTARSQALLELVEAHRCEQCDAIIGAAEQQAAAARAQSRADARRRLREAWAEEQARSKARVAAAQAELQTRRRLHEQAQATAWLKQAWERLPAALQARWSDPAARRAWVDAALAEARRVLAPGDWRIVYAPGWPEVERRELTAHLAIAAGAAGAAGRRLEFIEQADLQAGLRIVADSNVVDATLAGLTADRDEIGAGLLGEIGTTP